MKDKSKVSSCLHSGEISRSRYFQRFLPSGVHLLSPTKLRQTEREQKTLENVFSITQVPLNRREGEKKKKLFTNIGQWVHQEHSFISRQQHLTNK